MRNERWPRRQAGFRRVVVSLLCAALIVAASVAKAAPLLGDANCDGQVNRDDFDALVAGLFGGGGDCAGLDVNGDGVISAADVVALLEVLPPTTPTETPTPTIGIPTPSNTPAPSPTVTIGGPTQTPTPSRSVTPSPSQTPSITITPGGPTFTRTRTGTVTRTPSNTRRPTRTTTASATGTATRTGTRTRTFTRTTTPPTSTATPVVTATSTATCNAQRTDGCTRTPTPTITSTGPSPTRTATGPTRTPTRTGTASRTPTNTRVPSVTTTPSKTRTASRTATITRTRTATRTGTGTRTVTNTRAPTNTPTPPPTRTTTQTRTITPTRTPSRTGTPTIPRPAGAEVVYFGIATADNHVRTPTGQTPDGVPIFTFPVHFGFLIVVEARPGTNRIPPGACGVGTVADCNGGRSSLEIIADRALGNGSAAVCDIEPPNFGGVPGVASLDLNSAQAIDPINDLACRFEIHSMTTDACTLNSRGVPGFVREDLGSGTIQYCSQLVLGSQYPFPSGLTRLKVQVQDGRGTVGNQVQIAIQIP